MNNIKLFPFIFLINPFVEVSVKDGEKPQKFGESWSKPIRQVSLTYDSPKPIDALGTDTNDKIEVEPQKKAVPVKNNWSVGLVDSESEDEIVPDSEGGEEEEEEEEISGDEQSDNEFLNDEAIEAGPDYQSGDSMDSSERREAEGMLFSKIICIEYFYLNKQK